MNPSLFVGDLKLGDSARVRDVTGGRDMQQRMRMLGIRRGTDTRVVHGPANAGRVCQVGGEGFALVWGRLTRFEWGG